MKVLVKAEILGRNENAAAENAALLARHGIYALNLLGSPGAGKTTLLERTLAALSGELRIAVVEGDLFTDKDAARIERCGAPVVQINTSGGCHLDAAMVAAAFAQLDLTALDLIVIENVGNLVCPAEFALGEDAKAVVLSVTEGDDKPLKYPLIFKESAAALLNKCDLLPYTDFDMAAARRDIAALHPGIAVLPVSARTEDGMAQWLAWLRAAVAAKRKGGAR
ncbi:hydrogenase nickel incorporation protein HypB [Selenomonas artemidis]|uniref:hydrogenase nickel incorporation protein HypB n=1 Tax=Selenomonas artemidis TaxID=671224 RepID=UPI0023F430F9|nr:hydrogenase nickel incorporation protein HypB [Selenomonas artemidis]